MSRTFSTTQSWSADIEGFLILSANVIAKNITTFPKDTEPWPGAQTVISVEVTTPGLQEAFDTLPEETWHEDSVNSEIRWDMTMYGWGKDRFDLLEGRVYTASGPFLGSPWTTSMGREQIFPFKAQVPNMLW